MRVLLVVLAVSMMAVNSWADCTKYDYSELRDMTLPELESAAQKNKDDEFNLLKYGADTGSSHQKRMVCIDTLNTIYRVMNKKFPETVKPKRTYEECMEVIGKRKGGVDFCNKEYGK